MRRWLSYRLPILSPPPPFPFDTLCPKSCTRCYPNVSYINTLVYTYMYYISSMGMIIVRYNNRTESNSRNTLTIWHTLPPNVYKMLSNSIVRCTKKSIHYPLLLCTLHKSHTIQLAITHISTIGTSYMEQYCMHNAQRSSVGCCLSISLYIINVYSMRGLCCSVLHRIVRHCSTASRTVT